MSEKTKKFKVCDGCGVEQEADGDQHGWTEAILDRGGPEKDYCPACWRIMSFAVLPPYRAIFDRQPEGLAFGEIERVLVNVWENVGSQPEPLTHGQAAHARNRG